LDLVEGGGLGGDQKKWGQTSVLRRKDISAVKGPPVLGEVVASSLIKWRKELFATLGGDFISGLHRKGGYGGHEGGEKVKGDVWEDVGGGEEIGGLLSALSGGAGHG